MEKNEFQHDYQRFLEQYNIKRKTLPETLVTMMDLVENHLAETKAQCTTEVCKEISKRLKNVPDEIMDILFIYVQEEDLIPESAFEQKLLIKDKEPNLTPEQIIEKIYEKGGRSITTTELEKLGLVPLQPERFLYFGRFILKHNLFGTTWNIFKGSIKV
jgi:hypothetical protein